MPNDLSHRTSRKLSPGWHNPPGVNAVELLPVHEFCIDDFLRGKGLTNYRGYNTAAFFAPEISFGTRRRPGCQVEKFKTLVRELHRAGIEGILDVVYNHTGEGNEPGPTFSFKGIDNPSYYVLTGGPHEPARYCMNCRTRTRSPTSSGSARTWPPRWDDPEERLLCCLLDGSEEPSEAGSYFLFLVLNGDFRQREVMVPPLPPGLRWRRAIDTSRPAGEDFMEDGDEPLLDPADRYLVDPMTTVVLLGN
ncbi:MAG: hypothetical protein OHK0028_20070 [Deltaproteobacteria bacterium]